MIETRWAMQHDGVLEENTLYQCAECGYPGLTKDTAAWKGGEMEKGERHSVYGIILVCENQADCWRRAEFMGRAPWLDVAREAHQSLQR